MRLDWDLDGERLYEIGTDRGVVYPFNEDTKEYEAGYAWNGLTGVDESPSGGEANSVYANNGKYLNNRSDVEFSGTINAYMYPEEFELCDGTASFANSSVKIHQQKRKKFAFSYRSLIGNDIEGEDYGYKIHLFYNCMASPSSKSMETVNNDPNAVTFSWELSTTPIEIDGMKRSAHIIIDSRSAFPASLKMLEDMLYGTEDTEPKMPTVDELRDLYPQITLSGSFIHVTDGAPDQPIASLKAYINPDQDLHGFDNPWVGGTGKNLLDYGNIETQHGTVDGVESNYVLSVNGRGNGVVSYRLPDSMAGNTFYLSGSIERTGTHENEIAVQLKQIRAGSSEAVFTTLASYTDNALSMADISVAIPAGSTDLYVRFIASATNDDSTGETMTVTAVRLCAEQGQPWSPYANICPITATSQKSAIHVGSNLLSESPSAVNGSVSPFTDGGYTFTVGSSGFAYSYYILPNGLAGKTVYLSGILRRTGAHVNDIAARFSILKADGSTTFQQFPVYVDNEVVYNDAPIVIRDVVGGARNIRLQFVAAATEDSSAGETMTVKDMRLCLDAGRPFTEYNRKGFSIYFGQDVYGGELDFTSGILAVMWASKILSGNDIQARSSATTGAGDYRFYTTSSAASGIKVPILNTDPADLLCSLASTVAHTSADYGVSVNRLDKRIYFNIKGCGQMTLEEFKAWVDANNIQIAYALETPQLIQLTPKQITTFLGDNSFWMGEGKGEFELTYRATDIHD